jgi:hypothetical protein
MTSSVTPLIPMEMLDLAYATVGVFASFREVSTIVVVVESIVDVSPETVSAAVPRTRADEESAVKPLRAVIPIRRAGVRSSIVIAIGAHGSRPDLDADLSSLRLRCIDHARGSDQSHEE